MRKSGKTNSRLLEKAVETPMPEVPIADASITYTFDVTKVDAEERTAEGIATAEVLDYQGDVITMACAIDAFKGFESAGAIREMHQPRAVGKLLKWWPIVEQKAIGVKVFISKSRDGEDVMTKLKEGILRGFSIGARATDWAFSQFKSLDGGNQTARLVKKMFITELSLVDMPACPKALISIVKVDDPTAPAGAVAQVTDPAPQTEELAIGVTNEPKTQVVEQGGVMPVSPSAGDEGPISEDDRGLTKSEAVALLEEMRRMLAARAATPVATDEMVKAEADDKAKTEAQLSARGEKSGIARKDGEPLTPPKGYPTDPGDYADPANWSWPVKPEGRAHSAISYYNGGRGKDKYSDREWAILGRRIARLAGATLGIKYRFDVQEKRIVNPNEGDNKMEKGDLPSTLEQAQTLMDRACKDLGGPDAASMLEQAAAALGVAKDIATRQMAAGSASDSAPSSSSSSPSGTTAAPSQPSPASVKKDDPSLPSLSSPSASGSVGNGGSNSPQSLNLAAAPSSPATTPPSSTPSSSPSSPVSSAPVKKEADEMDEKAVKELVSKAVSDALAAKDAAPASTPAPVASDIPVSAPAFIRKSDPYDEPLVKALIAGDEAKVHELSRSPEGMPDQGKLMDALEIAVRKEFTDAGLIASSRFNKWGHDYPGQSAPTGPGGPDLNNLQTLLAGGGPVMPEMTKGLTAAQGFVGINLERPAKLMLPYIAALRRRIASDNMATGSNRVEWRTQLGFGGWDFSAFGTPLAPVAGNVGVDLAGNAITFRSFYETQAIHGDVQFEAIPFAQGFDDPVQIETSRGLATLLRIEELLVLGANNAIIGDGIVNPQLVVTLAQSTLNVVGTFKVGAVVDVFVTALTLAGTLNADLTPGLAPNPANAIVGETNCTIGGLDKGHAQITVAAANADFLDVSWPAIEGAVGYKVYCNSAAAGGAAGFLEPLANMRYAAFLATGAVDLATAGDAITYPTAPAQRWVNVNHVQIWAYAPVTAFIYPTVDDTVNALTFEGLIPWSSKGIIEGNNLPALTGYAKIALDAGGRPLTTQSAGIAEFDYILQQLWTTWHISPTLIICSPQSAVAVSSKLLAANSNFMYRIEVTQERNQFIGGAFVGGYVNKFAANMLTGQPASVPVWAHPYMPDGSFLFLSERIPYAYSREGRGFSLDVAVPYTYFELARVDRSFPFSLFFTETMKCYHPYAQCIIQGARVDA